MLSVSLTFSPIIMQGGAIYFNCIFGARLLEISGSSFVANGDDEVDEGGSGIDAPSGPKPVICVGAECNNGKFTCTEYMSYVETVLKLDMDCLGSLGYGHFADLTFFNLPEGATTVVADGFQIADLCPVECSEVVSRVSHTYYILQTTNTTMQ
jgi:hypothetical protein